MLQLLSCILHLFVTAYADEVAELAEQDRQRKEKEIESYTWEESVGQGGGRAKTRREFLRFDVSCCIRCCLHLNYDLDLRLP